MTYAPCIQCILTSQRGRGLLDSISERERERKGSKGNSKKNFLGKNNSHFMDTQRQEGKRERERKQ